MFESYVLEISNVLTSLAWAKIITTSFFVLITVYGLFESITFVVLFFKPKPTLANYRYMSLRMAWILAITIVCMELPNIISWPEFILCFYILIILNMIKLILSSIRQLLEEIKGIFAEYSSNHSKKIIISKIIFFATICALYFIIILSYKHLTYRIMCQPDTEFYLYRIRKFLYDFMKKLLIFEAFITLGKFGLNGLSETRATDDGKSETVYKMEIRDDVVAGGMQENGEVTNEMQSPHPKKKISIN